MNGGNGHAGEGGFPHDAAHHPHGHGDEFDAKAAGWDEEPGHAERAKVVAGALARHLPLDGDTSLLEYGAGTGLVTERLVDRVGPITLADTSAGMREVMEQKAEAGRLGDRVRILDLDLNRDPPPDERFDVIVTVLTLHHVQPVEPVLDAFASLLEPSGHLAVVDLDEEDGSFHGDGFGGHHGFDRAELTEQLRSAGFVGVTVRDCHHIVRDGVEYPMFLATARAAG